MVKVPRSKGCRVCVQRRIKCDQTRPACQRCTKANRLCPGFDQIKFVDEGPGLRKFFGSLENETVDIQGQSPLSISQSSQGQPQIEVPLRPRLSSPRDVRKSTSPIDGDSWQQGGFERGAFVSLLAPTVYQDQLLANFIASIRQPTNPPTIQSHSFWLAEVAARRVSSGALNWAIRAISISQLARKIGDVDMIQTSRRLYGGALLRLNDALQDREEGLSSDTLSATLLLSFYEVFNCTDRYSWIEHAGGAGRLIQLRGPDRHRSGFGRLIFAACRSTLIMDAFRKLEECFLAAPAWRKLCWDIHQDLRFSASLSDVNEEYFQELVSQPGYLKNASKVVADPEADVEGIQIMQAEGYARRSAFQSIRIRMDEHLAESGFQPVEVASACNDQVFPIVYEFPDIQVASLYCCYWAATCNINISLMALEARMNVHLEAQSPPQHNLQSRNNSPINIQAFMSKSDDNSLWKAAGTMDGSHVLFIENAMYAREVCKCAEYMSNTPFMGPLYLLFGIRLALRMPITRPEKMWIMGKLNEVARNMGLAQVEIQRYKKLKSGGPGVEWEQTIPMR